MHKRELVLFLTIVSLFSMVAFAIAQSLNTTNSTMNSTSTLSTTYSTTLNTTTSSSSSSTTSINTTSTSSITTSTLTTTISAMNITISDSNLLSTFITSGMLNVSSSFNESNFTVSQLGGLRPVNRSSAGRIAGTLSSRLGTRNLTVRNVSLNVQYGSLAYKGSYLRVNSRSNYLLYSNSTGTLFNYTVNVTKATPRINVTAAQYRITGEGNYTVHALVMPFGPHRGQYQVTISYSSSLLPGNKGQYSYSLYFSNGTKLIPNVTVNASQVGLTRTFWVDGNVNTYFKLDFAGNANYTAVDPSGVIIPSGVTYYDAVTVQNAQSTSYSANAQLMVPFNALKYQSYEANNLQNVEFFFANGTVIPSWLEGNTANEIAQTGNFYSSNSIVYWLRIYNSTALLDSEGYYMIFVGFVSTATNLFGGGTIGAAPQLFCPGNCPQTFYGQYDNGANVFSFYDNFSGTAISTARWSGTQGGTGANVINNGLTINAIGTNSVGIVSAATLAYPHWFEGLVSKSTTKSLNADMGFEESTSATFGTKGYDSGFEVVVNGTASQNVYGKVLSSSGGVGNVQAIQANVVTTSNTPEVIGVAWSATGTQLFHSNYNKTAPLVNSTTAIANQYSSIVISKKIALNANLIVQWVRARSYPPSGIPASVIFGYTCKAPSALPSGISYYACVALQNAQATALTSNSQIAVGIDAAEYKAYEMPNMQNVEFFWPNGTVIPSWLEGNILAETSQKTNLYTSGSLLYWLRIFPGANTLPAATVAGPSYNTVYLGFAPLTTNTLTLVQSACTQNSVSGSNTLTFPNKVSSGNVIVVAAGAGTANYAPPQTALTISDTQLDSYTLANEITTSANSVGASWYSVAKTTATDAVTINFGAYFIRTGMCIYELSGAAAPLPTQTAGTTTLSGGSINSNTVTALSYAAGAFALGSGGSDESGALTSTSGFTLDMSGSYQFAEHEVFPSAGSTNFAVSWLAGGYESYADSAAIFNPSTSATNFYGSGTVGVAPQLYCALGCPQSYYGQYDNGNNIFSFYDNFTGTSLSAKWSGTKGGTPPTVAVANVLTMSVSTTGKGGIISASTIAYPQWLDGLITTSTASASKEIGFEQSTSSTFGANAYDSGFIALVNGTTSQFVMGKALSATGTLAAAGPTRSNVSSTATKPEVIGVAWTATGTQTFAANYNKTGTLSNSTLAIGNQYASIDIINKATLTYTANVQWIRSRSYPPSGMMPPASSGPIVLSGVSLAVSPTLPSTQSTGTLMTLTSSWQSGFPPYTVNYVFTNTVTSAILENDMVAGIFTTSNTYSWTIPSAYAGNTIMMNVIVYDSAGWTANSVQSGTLTVSSSGSTCVPVLSNTLITFPSTKPGSYASTSNAETVTNSGTATSNIMIDGGNWISTSPAAAFWVTNTLWSATSGANIGTQLTNTITGFDTKVQVASSSSATLYFGVNIPVGQTAATYAETINVLESC